MIYDNFFNKIDNIGFGLYEMSELKVIYNNTKIVQMYARYTNHTFRDANLIFLSKVRDGMTIKEVKKEFIFCILQQMCII